jgi:deoxycytidylate deaminase
MLSVGYNGPPATFPTQGWCSEWCPRAIAASRSEPVSLDYSDCYAVHSEANAILRSSRRPFEPGTTIYTSSSVCRQCAQLIAASGITRVVVEILPAHRHRSPDEIVAFLTEAGVEVVVWRAKSGSYRAVFEEANGIGPHGCYFCGVIMPWPEVIHHLDHDHFNNVPENLVPAHANCHTSYHADASAGLSHVGALIDNPKTSGPWTRRAPMLRCDSCGLTSSPGWIKRHCARLEHTSAELETWLKTKEESAYRCKFCGRAFESTHSRAQHESWCSGERHT